MHGRAPCQVNCKLILPKQVKSDISSSQVKSDIISQVNSSLMFIQARHLESSEFMTTCDTNTVIVLLNVLYFYVSNQYKLNLINPVIGSIQI